MDTYMSIVEDAKNSVKSADTAKRLKLSDSTVSRVRSHARKNGLLGLTEKHQKMLQTRRKMKRLRAAQSVRDEKKVITQTKTETEKVSNKNNHQEFIKVDFKGTEIHIEKSGKIFVTSEGIVVR